MIYRNFKKGFTLGEILIALTIVGVLAVLIIPGFLKDINNKSKMSLLRSTISSLNNAVQNELIKGGSNQMSTTDIYNDPAKFLKTLDPVQAGEAFADSYMTYEGDNISINIPDNTDEHQAKALLKSGVGIGIINNLYGKNSTGIVIDLNGKHDPNIVGVDYFELEILWDNDYEKGRHTGDIGGYFNGGINASEEKSISEIQTLCLKGNGAACYRTVELSGFDPNYITEDYTKN